MIIQFEMGLLEDISETFDFLFHISNPQEQILLPVPAFCSLYVFSTVGFTNQVQASTSSFVAPPNIGSGVIFFPKSAIGTIPLTIHINKEKRRRGRK